MEPCYLCTRLIELATAGRTPDPVVAHLQTAARQDVLQTRQKLRAVQLELNRDISTLAGEMRHRIVGRVAQRQRVVGVGSLQQVVE